jgi:hypothetical protein
MTHKDRFENLGIKPPKGTPFVVSQSTCLFLIFSLVLETEHDEHQREETL